MSRHPGAGRLRRVAAAGWIWTVASLAEAAQPYPDPPQDAEPPSAEEPAPDTTTPDDAPDVTAEKPETAEASQDLTRRERRLSLRPPRDFCERPGSALARRLPRTRDDLRRMSCHSFFAPSAFDDAFITSTVGTTTAAALFLAPGFVAAEGDAPYDLLLIGASLSARVSVQFAGWVMLYGTGTGQVVVGSNLPSALNPGASGAGSWDVGLGAKLFRVKKPGTQMSIRAKFVGSDGISLRPFTLVEAIDRRAQNDQFLTEDDLAALLTNQDELGGGLSLNLAQAFGTWGSLQASVAAKAGRANAEVLVDDGNGGIGKAVASTTFIEVDPGVALTFDGWPWFPVALQVEYDLNWRRDMAAGQSQDLTDHLVFGGLFYTGHPDIVIGLRGGGVVASSLPVQAIQVAAGLELQVYL